MTVGKGCRRYSMSILFFPTRIKRSFVQIFNEYYYYSTFSPSEFFSKISALREPSPIRDLIPIAQIPGMISFGSGSPNTSLFPFHSFSFQLHDGTNITLTKQEMELALQYSSTEGISPLVNWLKKLQSHFHSPLLQPNSTVAVTNGSQEGLTKAFEMLLNPGDPLLIESPTYCGTLAFLRPMNIQLIDIKVDQFGLNPTLLESILDNWPKDKKKPKVLYTIPTGGNPSGVSTSLERKLKIYQIAQKHNLIILEDDPYYYIQFSKIRIPSYLSLDMDGRVLRFDSFSKIVSSGMRVGFVTGHKDFIKRIILHSQSSMLQSSGLSQMAIYKVLEAWDINGISDHFDTVTKFYKYKRDFFQQQAEFHLKGLAEWNLPSAGMFFWFRIIHCKETTDLIKIKAKENNVLLVPGKMFMPNNEDSQYVRASYSNVDEHQMKEGLNRFQTTILSNT